jgi:hypothetical protein
MEVDAMEHYVRGAALGVTLGILLAAVLVWAGYFFYCPCAVVPGGWLLGEEYHEPVGDWSSANDVGLCQVQVSAGLPHSVNVNCMASGKKLFLSCSNCMGKRWSSAALADPRGRIRIGDAVYPVTVNRVEDPATLDEAWIARSTKLGRPLEIPRAVGWWSFQVRSR